MKIANTFCQLVKQTWNFEPDRVVKNCFSDWRYILSAAMITTLTYYHGKQRNESGQSESKHKSWPEN